MDREQLKQSIMTNLINSDAELNRWDTLQPTDPE